MILIPDFDHRVTEGRVGLWETGSLEEGDTLIRDLILRLLFRANGQNGYRISLTGYVL